MVLVVDNSVSCVERGPTSGYNKTINRDSIVETG